ncbi:MAG: amidohydrolase family protein [Chitinophagaceae bacterium]
MPFKILLFVCCFIAVSASAQTYISNVTVLDVEKQKLLPAQTVVISNGRISSVQPSKKIKIPENARVIDGSGKYLMPGMTDAHIHFFQSGGLYTRPDVIDLRKYVPYEQEILQAKEQMVRKLRLYLANGITNVIDVGASMAVLKHSQAYRQTDSLPGIFITGPLATTYEPSAYKGLKENAPFNLVKTEDEAVAMVKSQLEAKPDFIKIWYIAGADGLAVEASARKNLPIVKAVIDEAHRHQLPVAVHATERITAQLAVENGADFLVHNIDDEIVNPELLALMKKNSVILCPTMIVEDQYNKTFQQAIQFSERELEMGDAFQLGSLLDLQHLADTNLAGRYKRGTSAKAARDRARRTDSIRAVNLKMLNDAGVLIAAGTDAGNIGTLHGSSYLDELMAMKNAGMSNWQVLMAATINGARVVRKQEEFGSIAANKKANLLLLDANPVEDLANLTKINQVMINGNLIDPESLRDDSPAALAQRQLNAYNLRNMDAFLEPYAEDVEIYGFPNELQSKGKEAMRTGYAEMFKNVKDLHCELVNRIVQGSVVIDHERVRFNGRYINAVAIYHIKDGKISKVYFIQ